MRALAMRFRGILRGGDTEKLTAWLYDADRSALYGIRRFVHTLRLDLAAVGNAITERWSNGQTEGQINRLKMLKQAMYGSEEAEAVWRRTCATCQVARRDVFAFIGTPFPDRPRFHSAIGNRTPDQMQQTVA